MIQINQLKLPVGHKPEELKKKAAQMLRLQETDLASVTVRRQSLDARKKPQLFYVYMVEVELKSRQSENPSAREKTENKKIGKREKKYLSEQKLVNRIKNPQIRIGKQESYQFVKTGKKELSSPPVIIGTGPAGLFCGLMLARHGYQPLLLERGMDVEQRQKAVELFWEKGILNPDSNVQFGEGGAGTFSDGKLNTLVKDSHGRNQLVLEIFHEFGADEQILYQNKPHIGTDVLSRIVKGMRKEIIRLGGQIRFGCQVMDLIVDKECRQIRGVITSQGERILSDVVVLAIGHSARDTFSMLNQQNIPMDPKAFAVGLRIQHPQDMLNLSQYGRQPFGTLGAADYKLTWKAASGRGIYSFCMCPGGYVVNASSEPNRLAVNGMSYHSREGKNGNSALIVTVTPEDFPDQTPLGGIGFQRRLEELAFQAGCGKIPVQLYGDFKARQKSKELGKVEPQMKGSWSFGELHSLFPTKLYQAFLEGMEHFGKSIAGFDRADALLAGVESRTSSPVRIWRDDKAKSVVVGLYPCGEGAGYAGGITSAAMDGVFVAEKIAEEFCPF